MRKIFMIIILVIFVSCATSRKRKAYVSDFTNLSTKEFANKYYTLSGSQKIDFTKIKKNKAYTISRPNDTYQVYMFSEDGYLYSSVLLWENNLKKLSNEKLHKSKFFSVEDDILKIEYMVSNPEGVFSVIEEGFIKTDTIFMKKKYHSKNIKKVKNLSNKIIIAPYIKVFKLGDYIVVEYKK
jgi:hypothetical protein